MNSPGLARSVAVKIALLFGPADLAVELTFAVGVTSKGEMASSSCASIWA